MRRAGIEKIREGMFHPRMRASPAVTVVETTRTRIWA